MTATRKFKINSLGAQSSPSPALILMMLNLKRLRRSQKESNQPLSVKQRCKNKKLFLKAILEILLKKRVISSNRNKSQRKAKATGKIRILTQIQRQAESTLKQ